MFIAPNVSLEEVANEILSPFSWPECEDDALPGSILRLYRGVIPIVVEERHLFSPVRIPRWNMWELI